MNYFIYLVTLLLSLQCTAAPGVANLKNSQIKSNVEIKGLLNAKNANFSGDILLNSNQATFKGSTIKGSITVHSDKHPVIELRCGTHVSGDITFQGSSGVINKSKGSAIEGKVTNGTVKETADDEKC